MRLRVARPVGNRSFEIKNIMNKDLFLRDETFIQMYASGPLKDMKGARILPELLYLLLNPIPHILILQFERLIASCK